MKSETRDGYTVIKGIRKNKLQILTRELMAANCTIQSNALTSMAVTGAPEIIKAIVLRIGN